MRVQVQRGYDMNQRAYDMNQRGYDMNQKDALAL